MGRSAYWNLQPRGVASSALGDANRGARTWPRSAVSTGERPPHRPPRAAGLPRFPARFSSVSSMRPVASISVSSPRYRLPRRPSATCCSALAAAIFVVAAVLLLLASAAAGSPPRAHAERRRPSSPDERALDRPARPGDVAFVRALARAGRRRRSRGCCSTRSSRCSRSTFAALALISEDGKEATRPLCARCERGRPGLVAEMRLDLEHEPSAIASAAFEAAPLDDLRRRVLAAGQPPACRAGRREERGVHSADLRRARDRRPRRRDDAAAPVVLG